MNSTYYYDTNLSVKDNILIYLNSKSDKWMTLSDIESDMYTVESNILYATINKAFKQNYINRKTSFGMNEFKITTKGEKHINKNKDRLHKTLAEYTSNEILNFLNKSSMWVTPIYVVNGLGLEKKYAGGMGNKLSCLYNNGDIQYKNEGGIRYYKHIDKTNELLNDKTIYIDDPIASTPVKEREHEPTQNETDDIVVPGVAEKANDYVLMVQERIQYLHDHGKEQSHIAKICFDALQTEYDDVEKIKQQEILENKRIEEMKYMEDHNFVFLEDQKKLQNEILDLKDQLNKKESKELDDRAMLEHMVKTGTIK